ncbi:hypothetical protein, partial [uncultured Selenomonas sp.]|uniref:hypothetical protein n=1 Tax=uncultured Selenomonas sp. TaxID=159275 RepID=UPI0028DCF7E9
MPGSPAINPARAEASLRAPDLKVQSVLPADILDADAQEAVGLAFLGNVDVEIRDPVAFLAAVENLDRRLRLDAPETIERLVRLFRDGARLMDRRLEIF